MRLLHKSKILFFALTSILAALAFSASAQVKNVNWSTLNGKDNEFVIYMPEGYLSASESNFYLSRSPATEVNNRFSFARYIGGTVLSLEYYDDNGKQIQNFLLEKIKEPAKSEQEISGFSIKTFGQNLKSFYEKSQFILADKRLYVVRTFSKSEDDKISDSFFNSVKLTKDKKSVAPNVPQGTTKIILPRLTETQLPEASDLTALTAEQADRPPIVLKFGRPKMPADARKFVVSTHVKFKVLLSASGQVTEVQILDNALKSLKDEVTEAAKHIIFIPAEKDGKLVSVYSTFEYGFSTAY